MHHFFIRVFSLFRVKNFVKTENVFVDYLAKHGLTTGNQLEIPDFCPEIIVVIPCFNEENILSALYSLKESYRFSPVSVLVIVVVNSSVNSPADIKNRNIMTVSEIEDFKLKTKEESFFKTEVIHVDDMPEKDAGVGLARKTGMDEAVRIFHYFGKDGIIACFDADSLCTSDYFIHIIEEFRTSNVWDAASIHFEHPLAGYPDEVLEAIIEYELHLRVFVGFQKWTGLPYAFQTIGSSMAVSASSYCKHGGMNKRKAGEDFYFLHKIGDKGKVGCIHSTMVIPSPRISSRVPFGTGKAVGDNVQHQKAIKTYNPNSFIVLHNFLQQLQEIYSQGWTKKLAGERSVVYDFLNLYDAEKHVRDCRLHTRDFQGFVKRFYQWFNAFKLMKYCHYCRDEVGYMDVEPLEAYQQLMKLNGHSTNAYLMKDAKEALLMMRLADKNSLL